MRPLQEARRDVIAGLTAMPTETISVDDARNRVTGEPVLAQESVPPFANSAMDGFAVRSEDVQGPPTTLDVIEDVAAGSVPTRGVAAGQATRIMTGAPMPEGADSVVMVEETAAVGDDRVEIRVAVGPGANVRPAGSDVAAGEVVVPSGIRLDGRHLASLSSVGGSVTVARRPTVAIMSTGDEVVPSTTPSLDPGTIRDTNRVLLRSMLDALSIPYIDLGIIGDDESELRDAYASAAAEADLIVSTGGVSMGDHDYVKHVLRDLGTVAFWRVAMQPAKPFAFGQVDGTPLFGLPGNPVSTFVAFEQFVRPALLHMMGATRLLRPRIRGTMGEDVATSPEKEVFLRVILTQDDGRFVALEAGAQGSNVISALAAADAFAVVPVGTGSLSAGDDVILEMFTWNESRGLDV